MKKLIFILALLLGLITTTFAGGGIGPISSQKQWLFKPLPKNDVSLEVERLDDNVQLHLFSQNMKNVDMIYVEKSKDPNGGFTRCSTVKVSEHLDKSKNYISLVDENPYAAGTDSYYRIRTVTASGTVKIYPVVGLSPIMPIEPIDDIAEAGK